MTRQFAGSIYTLELEDNKWYVGYSEEVDFRIACHFSGQGSEWTKQHKPVRIVDVQPGDLQIEKLTTLAVMARHGWQNVRGGPWCARIMSDPPPCMAKLQNLLLKLEKPEQDSDCQMPSEDSDCQMTSEDSDCQIVQGEENYEVLQTKADGLPTAWRVKITSKKAKKECPARGFKMIYANTRKSLIHKATRWERSN